ncbi:MAG: RING finger protein, partial [Candidatus Saliniplasma sp.]
ETYPMIEHDSPETWHIRDDIELSANITDDEGLENAYINYTQVDGIQHNVSLDIDNSTISIPAQNQTGTFSYYYWAVDESGLSNRSETFSIELLDLDDPYVMNVSQDSDVLSIYGNFTLEFSKPMNGTSVEDGLVITPDLNYDLTQIDEYRFEVNITAVPNQQYSINLDSQVAEDELGINLDSDFNTTFNTETSPDIVYEQEVFSIHKDSNISFSVECIDDFGVDNVQIEGTGPNGYTFAENLSDTGETWNIVLPRPNRTGQLDYRFIAEDSSGLLTYSENYSISILNPTEIRFKNVTGETDESFEFEIEITNPLGISDVELHYKENGMETVEDLTLTEGNAGDGLWTTQLDLDSEGEYEYSVVVTDLDGESVIEHSNKNIAVQESQSIFSNPFLYLLLIIVIAASTGGILYNRRDIGENIHEEETTSEQTEEESEDETEDTDKNLCTICFGEIEENIHICECGKKYHRSCINAIGECPICGNDNLKEGVENGGE